MHDKHLTPANLIVVIDFDFILGIGLCGDLSSECICIGTGKTLVSVMLMSHLLTLNPRHSVVFVVDRILLALQQSNVIRKELGNKLFTRFVCVSCRFSVTPYVKPRFGVE